MKVGKSKTTVSREVLLRRRFIHYTDVSTLQTKNVCIERFKCNIKENCKSPTCYKRSKNCKLCGKCNGYCKTFKEEICSNCDKVPYVCNCCRKKPSCPLSKWIYDAKYADIDYRGVLSNSRKGIALSETELAQVDEMVSPLLKKGQSIPYICSQKGDELVVSSKTIYKYLAKGLLNANPFDLKRYVQRKVRKKPGPTKLVDNKCRIGRTYDDYKAYMANNQDKSVVQLDTVEGKRGGKVLLTMLFTNCTLQLGFLREHNDAASVQKKFKGLRKTLTPDEFCRLFSVFLADRGTEFSDPRKIEVDYETGEIQCSLFYCDPQNTNQKSPCERNHEFIRYVIPKGTSLDGLTQNDINKMMNHINSYGREKFNYKSPIDLFESIYGSEIAKKLGIERVPTDDICLTPKLLK